MARLWMLCLLFAYGVAADVRYDPTWDSLDKRPLPSWYDDVKVGIFLHWGVFSVPSFGSEWFWYSWQGRKTQEYVDFMEKNYPPGFEYADFAPQFKAELWDPNAWADLFEKSGAKYVVLTSKHHEGFTNWPSKVSWNWNSMDEGPHRDLVGDLATAIRNRTSIHFGLYHSLFEWFNPTYLADKANKFASQDFVREKTLPELYEIVNAYKPELIWSDGDWEAPPEYWNSTEFLAWLYNDSPVKDTVVVNDRWGRGAICHHGGYYTCHDRYNPGHVLNHKWENAMTIDKRSWGFNRLAPLSEYLTPLQLITQLVTTVSCGGNILVNVGPTHDGRILPIFEERLTQMGQWLGVNGDAIYSSKPWRVQNDTTSGFVWYTSASNGNTVYAISLSWPTSSNSLQLGAPKASASTKVTLLGYSGEIKATPSSPSGLTITLPSVTPNQLASKWAYVFALTGVE